MQIETKTRKNKLTPSIESNIQQIVEICNSKYADQSFHGASALNRKILLDPDIADLLTPETIIAILTLKNKNDPAINLNRLAGDGRKTTTIADVIVFGLQDAGSIQYLPNNDHIYGVKEYEEQKKAFATNTNKFLQIRTQESMTIEVGIDVFLSEYIKDMAENIKFMRGVIDFNTLSALQMDYYQATLQLKQGNSYTMTHIHEKGEVFKPTQSDIKYLEKQMKNLDAFFDADKATKFILQQHPDYTFRPDDTKITAEMIRNYLVEHFGFTVTTPSVVVENKPTTTHHKILQTLGTSEPEQRKDNTQESLPTQEKEKVTVEKETVTVETQEQQLEHSETGKKQHDDAPPAPRVRNI